MVFSSHIFVYYFLPLALLLYYGIYKAPQRMRNGLLALLGYIFYGWASPKFVLLMFATTAIDWLLSLMIAFDTWRVWEHWGKPAQELPPDTSKRSRFQKAAITGSVISNLAVLGFFKYFLFGTKIFNGVVGALHMPGLEWHTALHIVLPLGISFYTFQSLSYTIDVYRGDAKVMSNFVDFACFVSMFPHLVAGPILKFSFLAEQIEHRPLTLEKFARGAAFFMLGMTKKIILANSCGQIADFAFNSGGRLPADAWYGAVAYAFQIYFDFSGYSDMAIGLGLMLGFVFARNFDHPYRSESITDFWRRWHISLSTWLREYLYIPLGGNRKGKTRTYFNLLLTMLLGGLWHGAAWTFIIWGGIQGMMLAFERSLGRTNPYQKLPRPIRISITFLIVIISWVFFRADDLHKAVAYFKDMTALSHPAANAALLSGVLYTPYRLIAMVAAGITVWLLPDTWEWTQRLTVPKALGCIVLFIASLMLLASQTYNPFIYFRF